MISLVLFLVICCCILIAASGFVYYQDYKKKTWKGASKKLTLAELNAMFGTRPDKTIDCQNVSNETLTWKDHQGLAAIVDWAAFNYQYCNTIPESYTSNVNLFSNYYSVLGPSPPKNDPALTESQEIESGKVYIIGNPVSGKILKLDGTGVLTLKNNTSGVIDWSTPGSSITKAVLKFDSNTYNAGNLCVFEKDKNLPIWCIQDQIWSTIPTTACSSSSSSSTASPFDCCGAKACRPDVAMDAVCAGWAANNPPSSGSNCPPGSYTGGDLATYQNTRLNEANLKNTSDTQPRFAMISDSGTFCVYRGAPGSIQGSPIICK